MFPLSLSNIPPTSTIHRRGHMVAPNIFPTTSLIGLFCCSEVRSNSRNKDGEDEVLQRLRIRKCLYIPPQAFARMYSVFCYSWRQIQRGAVASCPHNIAGLAPNLEGKVLYCSEAVFEFDEDVGLKVEPEQLLFHRWSRKQPLPTRTTARISAGVQIHALAHPKYIRTASPPPPYYDSPRRGGAAVVRSEGLTCERPSGNACLEEEGRGWGRRTRRPCALQACVHPPPYARMQTPRLCACSTSSKT